MIILTLLIVTGKVTLLAELNGREETFLHLRNMQPDRFPSPASENLQMKKASFIRVPLQEYLVVSGGKRIVATRGPARQPGSCRVPFTVEKLPEQKFDC